MKQHAPLVTGIALSLALLSPAIAQGGPPPGGMNPPQSHPPQNGHPPQHAQRPQQQRPPQQAERPQQPPQQQAHRPPASGYGNWNNSWGNRPPAPPQHFTNQSGWYAHVRACMQRYRSYDPSTDTWMRYDGRRTRCRL